MQIKLAFIAVMVVVLQGCALVGSSVPDETRVVDGPALSLPPDYELKPPSELAKKEHSYQAAEKAKGVLLGSKAEPQQKSEGDDWLVSQAGKADSGIREQLEAEASAMEEAEKAGWFNKMWGGDEAEKEVESAQ